MNNSLILYLFALLFIACQKEKKNSADLIGCNIQDVYAENEKKVTITSGIWGTVSLAKGDCMPTIPYTPCRISHCPTKRTVKIYQYTTISNAIPNNSYGPFFDSLNTQIIRQADTDESGFFQIDIPPGNYSIFVLEEEKLYADKRDDQNGLSPFNFSGGIINQNLVVSYVTH